MKTKALLILIFSLVLANSYLAAEESEIQPNNIEEQSEIVHSDSVQILELSPESISELTGEKNTSMIRIECNEPSAEVYINSVYQGRTKLTVRNLLPAQYVLEVRKNGFSTKKYFITTKKGYCLTYSVVLEK